jgi:hypothetical protein
MVVEPVHLQLVYSQLLHLHQTTQPIGSRFRDVAVINYIADFRSTN